MINMMTMCCSELSAACEQPMAEPEILRRGGALEDNVVVIYRKCIQRTICLLQEKRRFIEKILANSPLPLFDSAIVSTNVNCRSTVKKLWYARCQNSIQPTAVVLQRSCAITLNWRICRSSNSNSFCQPCFLCRCTNRLELTVVNSHTLATFKKRLKTHLFHCVMWNVRAPLYFLLWRYTSFIIV